MKRISDEEMKNILETARAYTVVILWKGPNYRDPDARAITWEHGKRNMELRLAGKLNVVIPFTDDGDIRGLDVFNMPVDDVKTLMAEDPAMIAGILRAEYRSGLSFANDSLR
jgi:hypothetical protein